MAFSVELRRDAVAVRLSGWDWAMNWRRGVEFRIEAIETASLHLRSDLESRVDHRALGVGTHDGSRRPGRRRVGTMVGRGVLGKQFWATGAGDGSSQLVVLNLDGHKFARAVLEVDEPEAFHAMVTDAMGRRGTPDDI